MFFISDDIIDKKIIEKYDYYYVGLRDINNVIGHANFIYLDKIINLMYIYDSNGEGNHFKDIYDEFAKQINYKTIYNKIRQQYIQGPCSYLSLDKMLMTCLEGIETFEEPLKADYILLLDKLIYNKI